MQEYKLRPTAGITEQQYPFQAFPDPQTEQISSEIINDEKIIVLHHFFSRSECTFYIDQMDKLTLLPIPKGMNYRSNIRCRVRAPELSKISFEKAKPFLKNLQLTPDDYKQCGVGYKLHGVCLKKKRT